MEGRIREKPTAEAMEQRYQKRLADAHEMLNSRNLSAFAPNTPGNKQGFWGLDYLLIPYDRFGHMMLLGIAPKQKFFFLIDSVDPVEGTMTMHDWPMSGLAFLALSQIPRDQLGPKIWKCYGRWTAPDRVAGEPPAVWQRDGDSKYFARPTPFWCHSIVATVLAESLKYCWTFPYSWREQNFSMAIVFLTFQEIVV